MRWRARASYAKAAETYAALVGRFDRESSAEFLMDEARCQRRLGKPDDAARRLERLLAELGETSYAGAARIQLGELQPPPK